MFFLLAAALARAADPLADADTLDPDALVRAALDVNPGIDAAEAALAAARARVDVAGAWDDPRVAVGVAPLSVDAHAFGWSVDVEQDLPLWGMRRLGKDMAAADADAADARLGMMRLEMARMAAMLATDWWSVHRQIVLMEETMQAVDASRDAALARYAAGKGTNADTLALVAESAAILAEHHAMQFERDVVGARINALLRRAPDAPVPPPPPALPAAAVPEGDADRPEAEEAAAMVRAAEAEVRMAKRARLPMVGWMAGWDTMQEMPEHRLMAGVMVEVPLAQAARAGAVAEAEAGRSRAQAEAARMEDAVALSVAEARLRWRGQEAALSVIEGELIPAAEARVETARAAWAAGAGDVRTLLDAERGLRDARTRQALAAAALALRAAELRLALGALPGDGGAR